MTDQHQNQIQKGEYGDQNILIKVRGLKTWYPIRTGLFKKISGYVKAVDNVDLDIYRGEVLGVVGESGCGKTTLGKSILQLIKPYSGEVRYQFHDGEKNLCTMPKEKLDNVRNKLQIVFQDPYSSLNPAFTIFGSMEEPLIRFGMKSKSERRRKVAELLKEVNLPENYMERYPNEFSGGQRQRIGIARALSVDPEFVVCDEAVSALDVSIQAQVINMFEDLQKKLGVAYLFIAHDLLVVHHISKRIAVMYLGKMVETADADELNAHPIHPYTTSLLSAVPYPDPKVAKSSKRIILEGDVPSPMNPPSGCRFHTRCPYATQKCSEEMPQFKEHEPGHWAACHLLDK